MDGKWAIVLGIIIFLPIITLACLGKGIVRFRAVRQEVIIGKCQVVNGKNILFPLRLRAKLENTHRYNQKTIQDVIVAQRKMILWLFLHGTLGVIYLVTWLVWLKENQSGLKMPFCAIFLFRGMFCSFLYCMGCTTGGF